MRGVNWTRLAILAVLWLAYFGIFGTEIGWDQIIIAAIIIGGYFWWKRRQS